MMTECSLMGPRFHYCCFQLFDLCVTVLPRTLLLPVDPPYSRPGALGQSRSKGSRFFCSAADRKRACSVASSRRSVCQGTAKNSARKNKNSALFFIFSRAVFFAAPWLTDRLEEATCSGTDRAEIVFRRTTLYRHSRNDLSSVTQI